MADTVLEAHKQHSDAKDKFDHLILAILVAIIAYFAKGIDLKPIGLNPETIYLTSLLMFIFATIAGFKRLEYTMEMYRLNHKYLVYEEAEETDKVIHCKKLMDDVAKGALKSYKTRNFLLFLGMFAFLAGKLLAAYAST